MASALTSTHECVFTIITTHHPNCRFLHSCCVMQWTGKCIGAKTIYTFFAFLASLGMLMCFVIVVVVVAVARRKDAFSFENA